MPISRRSAPKAGFLFGPEGFTKPSGLFHQVTAAAAAMHQHLPPRHAKPNPYLIQCGAMTAGRDTPVDTPAASLPALSKKPAPELQQRVQCKQWIRQGSASLPSPPLNEGKFAFVGNLGDEIALPQAQADITEVHYGYGQLQERSWLGQCRTSQNNI